jgi:putative drug exporter of the RND superfamily
LIFPVAAALILLVLVFTLRSALAPLYLLAAVALELAATLGAAVLVFQALGGAARIAFTMPLVLFLFAIALGTDYNILMTARPREEMLAGKPARQAVAESVRHVAPAIAAAGLVLSSSFGSLMLASDQGSREVGFAMALGILIASSVLVPAITALPGRHAEWPARAVRERRAARHTAGRRRRRSRPRNRSAPAATCAGPRGPFRPPRSCRGETEVPFGCASGELSAT